MASIGWIDFSTNDRNRVGSVLDLLRPEGMFDELGLGTIRDALANQMFPGISTIQTRAKYFFIIPYILYDYQKIKPTHRKGKTPSKYLEEREYEIMWKLGDYYRTIAEDSKTRESFGVIGITKFKPQKIVRRPSAIYWNGLYTYRFIDTQGLSAESFLQQSVNPNIDTLLSSVQQNDDFSGDDADAEYENTFHIKVPPRLTWNENLTLDLHKEEAEFFRDRIIAVTKNKLITELLQNNMLWETFIKSNNFIQFAKIAIELPISGNLKTIITLAHDFSELMYGAHLAYNCRLHNKVFNSKYFDHEWSEWLHGIQDNMLNYNNFNPDILFSYAGTTRPSSVQFVKDWWKNTQSNFPDLKYRDLIIENQEACVKGSKARLKWNKTDDVKENSWLGLKHFDYRFFQSRTILKDIRTGLMN